MRRNPTNILSSLALILALTLATTGCKLKLVNARTPSATGPTIVDTGSDGGSASTGSVTPGIAITSGGMATGTGVRLHVTIGEPASGAVMTGTGVRAQIGVISVLNGH